MEVKVGIKLSTLDDCDFLYFVIIIITIVIITVIVVLVTVAINVIIVMTEGCVRPLTPD